MPTRSPAHLAHVLLGVVVAGTVLAGCADDGSSRGDGDGTGVEATGDGDTTTSEVPPAGDVPPAPVLPDSLSVSQDGSQVLADCWEGVCRWDTADGSLTEVTDGSHVAISPDWSLLAGVGDDASVLLVDPESGEVVDELAGLQDEEVTDGSPVQDIAFSTDGSLVAAAGPDGEVMVWSVEDGAEVASIDTGARVLTLAFSPDGDRLATAGNDPVAVFDVASGDPVGTLDGSTEGTGLAWSPDGRWLAAPGPGGATALWSTDDLTLVERLPGSLQDVAFAPDARTLAVTDTDDEVVRLWTPRTIAGDSGGIRPLTGHTDAPHAVVFAPDGSNLYTVSGGDGILAWDVGAARLTRKLEHPEP